MNGKSMTDVIADIRKRAEHAHDLYVDDPGKTVSHFAVSEMLKAIADMVEAAHKNECAQCEIAESERRLRHERLETDCAWHQEYIKQGEVMASTARQNVRLREAVEKIEDQVRWTIAHIECDELDDATGALYTAHAALEHINMAKGANA